MKLLSGLSAFPLTPMDRNGQIDAEALRALVARLCAAKVDSIGLLGSTGAYMYLAREERRRALALALEETGARIPVIVGVGALRTDDAVRLAQDAKALGATAVLLAAVSFSTAPLVRFYRRARRWIEGTLAIFFGAAGIRLLLTRT
ncbi:dihydrodipicolinate synthase family protein (plasmid) [Rhizobium ruizarguesonis]|uniref:Dihydrodipicolinate synthase family protein n=1 Tax=Rhizobium ruizarguesonis TaxID=2081791 RepID=A0ACD5EGG3_9HYPH